MRQRCLNLNDPNYQAYGAKGVTICESWKQSFQSFLKDMGKRPHGTSLDRINNDGDYEPGNCRWATRSEQNRNRRNNRTIMFRGVSTFVPDLLAKFGIKKSTFYTRIKRGWTLDRALNNTNLCRVGFVVPSGACFPRLSAQVGAFDVWE